MYVCALCMCALCMCGTCAMHVCYVCVRHIQVCHVICMCAPCICVCCVYVYRVWPCTCVYAVCVCAVCVLCVCSVCVCCVCTHSVCVLCVCALCVYTLCVYALCVLCVLCECVGGGTVDALSLWFSSSQGALGCGTTSRVGSPPTWVRWSSSVALNSSESSTQTKVGFPQGLFRLHSVQPVPPSQTPGIPGRQAPKTRGTLQGGGSHFGALCW